MVVVLGVKPWASFILGSHCAICILRACISVSTFAVGSQFWGLCVWSFICSRIFLFCFVFVFWWRMWAGLFWNVILLPPHCWDYGYETCPAPFPDFYHCKHLNRWRLMIIALDINNLSSIPVRVSVSGMEGEPALQSCPLASTLALCQACSPIHIVNVTTKQNIFKKWDMACSNPLMFHSFSTKCQ